MIRQRSSTRPLLSSGSLLIIPALLAALLAACRDDPAPARVLVETLARPTATVVISSESASATSLPATDVIPTETAVPPTATPSEPLAALVNNEPVFLTTYEKELARYEQAQIELGLTPGADDLDYRSIVLDSLIEQKLIIQAAEASGFRVTPEMVDQKLAELMATAGDSESFATWLENNQYTEEEFRGLLAADMLTALVVEQVTAGVPYEVEQVRARYLQVEDAALAQSLLEQIRNNSDFASLARQYSLDRTTGQNGGDLGYFAPGSLLVPEVELAAFSLQPGEVSDLITVTSAESNTTTYYLVQVVERDLQRPLGTEMRSSLLRETFEAWLAELWAQAEVIRYVDVGA